VIGCAGGVDNQLQQVLGFGTPMSMHCIDLIEILVKGKSLLARLMLSRTIPVKPL